LNAAPEAPAQESGKSWTLERIARLCVQDIKQLRANAERLNQSMVAQLCAQALGAEASATRSPARIKSRSSTKARRLVARAKAFEARGVWLADRHKSWGGLRKSDGAVVLALWADAIASADGACHYLLWAPNVDGSHPWSDQAAGKERLEHCKRAMQLGQAEALLVYGESSAGYIPEDKAYTVFGADPETVVVLRVEMRGREFWATWGRKAASGR
jgi:hypothetical protein